MNVSDGWVEIRDDPDPVQEAMGRPGTLLCRVHPATGMQELCVKGRLHTWRVLDAFPLFCGASEQGGNISHG